MDNGKEELAKGITKIQEAARQGAEQAGQFAETTKRGWNDLEQPKKKQIIKRAVRIGVLCLLIFTIGLKGTASLAAMCSGVWLIYCAIKKKSKKLPAILTVVLLVSCVILPERGPAPSAVTEEYAVSHLTKELDQMDWTMRGEDHVYTIFDRKLNIPLATGYYFQVDEKERVTGIGVLLPGDIEAAIKDESGVVLILAAMQMYDSSISAEKGYDIIAQAVTHDEYKHKGITYSYVPADPTAGSNASLFRIVP